jgi:hypothetical protein
MSLRFRHGRFGLEALAGLFADNEWNCMGNFLNRPPLPPENPAEALIFITFDKDICE